MQWPLSVQPGPSSRLSLGNSNFQLPSFVPIQQPSQDDQNYVDSPQGSFASFQSPSPGSRLQPQRFYNQQLPQVGVNYHNLHYLASQQQRTGVTPTGATPPAMVNVPWSSHQVPYAESLNPPKGSGPSPQLRTINIHEDASKSKQNPIFHFLSHLL